MVLVVLGEILPQWEVALVSGYQNLQSDIGVTYYETGETGSQSLLCTKMAYSQVQLLAYSHLCTELQAQFLSGLDCFRRNPTPIGVSPGSWLSETAVRYGGHLLRNRRNRPSKIAMY